MKRAHYKHHAHSGLLLIAAHIYLMHGMSVCVCCVCVLLGHAVCSLNDEKTVVIVFRLNGNVTYSCFLFFLGTWESLCLSVSIRHQPCRDC